MIEKVFKRVFGTKNDREIKGLGSILLSINELEADLKNLSDDQLKAKTQEFKARLKQGETLEDLLAEAFACVREAAVRTLKMRHYDVQMVGGIILHRGKIAEMKTGEGKTLVATLPLYLNALSERGTHLITVNDYLAKRDAEWMGPIFEALGLRVGVIVHGLDDRQRQEAYAADVTYGTNNEFGFDYLRDNMKVTPGSLVQRELHFCIVDEVDSILIDEARTPLIISGPTNDSTDKYRIVNQIIPFLKRDLHYTVDEKSRSSALTDEGVEEVQSRLKIDNLYDPRYIELVHHVDQALKAHVLFKRDVDYVIRDNEVVIVDEFTGRLMPGRRYSDGLHQALEAKEGLQVANENQTLASITFQNYFRMYDKLAGMTGTADTEAEEFASIYKLAVSVIPTNKPLIRKDQADVIYKSEEVKFKAIAEDIKERNIKGQPVLVGTTTIEKSERLSAFLKRMNVKHTILNAKQHEKEAQVVEDAGQKGAVTIATNMAGRGTDIKLGEGVIDLGGLYILGCERHESRRIDNQLRGRAGRQGDPGESRFYLSLEDDLLRIFAGDRMQKVMSVLGMKDDEKIEAPMISRAIEDAQMRVEGRNFDIRKHLLKYDDVMNHQRKIVYKWRRRLLMKDDVQTDIHEMMEELIDAVVSEAVPPKMSKDRWNLKSVREGIHRIFNLELKEETILSDSNMTRDQDLYDRLVNMAQEAYASKEKELSKEIMQKLERTLLLHTLDDRWKEHLLDMDHLRDGINLRGYAQKDPILDYQKEGFRLFEGMFALVKQEFLEKLFRVRITIESPGESSEQYDPEAAEKNRREIEAKLEADQRDRAERAKKLNTMFSGGASSSAKSEVHSTVKREVAKVGRNDPCPCGSGKKYKKCHGTASATG